MLIFLDFDGVLRRLSAPPYRFERHLLERFEGCVREIAEARIVISSSWREAFSVPEMRTHFSEDVGRRIVGATPRAARPVDHQRFVEVRVWLRKRGLEEQSWVALDDDPLNYPPLEQVRLLDPEVGFDEPAAEWLRRCAEEEKNDG